ncbi:MAG: (Fe-S)-binding protein [Caldilineaceae bacterium]|nr:(Fe-S)-binding protein [Caldilineaceae bacterium]MBP8106227.1 (Fe-S)-binding protein [Caldilineaceae bacterium]MBP8121158.1 (Fe-S)-binding protein [Caldilineaceae bacterium]MBP9071551.1 (Fe-S)-binding protein [Caldilineaceae bacterium]
MLTIVEKILFLIVAGAAVYYGYLGFRNVFLVIRRGSGEPFDMGVVVERAVRALGTWVIMKPIWKTRTVASIFHGMVAWGFIFYFLVNFGDVVQGYFPIKFMGDGAIGSVYRFLADIFSISVLVGMVYFLLRRFVFNSPVLTYRENIKLMDKVKAGAVRRDSLIVGLFILAHVGFRFLGETFIIALERLHLGHGDAAQPFANLVSNIWGGLGEGALTVGQHLSWWLALGLILAFIPYFPRTKHFHLIMSAFNFGTKPERTSLGELTMIDFEDESIEEFGVAKIEDLPWTLIVDAYSCIMCNRCQDVCPAYNTGKELSPAALEVNKRYYLNEHGAALARGETSEFNLLDFAITESAVWACTACGACVDICPVGNEPMFDIMYMRRNLMLMENSFPSELKTAYRGMERNGNPWNISARDRMNWTGDLPIPTVDDNPDFDVLWWVGCAPSYDPRAQETAKAFAKVMNAAGVNFAILGEMERCTGDSARRSGNEALFFEMATGNIEVLNEFVGDGSPKRIVTTCPHCMHTLGKEYGALGGHYDVIHHTQLLSELTAARKISVQGNGESDTITFHDPCYLGRHNGVVDAPRDVLGSLSNVNMVEMPRSGKQSFCCGAGGAQMWKEEEHGDASVSVTRYEEAAATGAKTIAVGCPFCLTMMTDASKAADKGVVVKDIAEIIAERL